MRKEKFETGEHIGRYLKKQYTEKKKTEDMWNKNLKKSR